jgi:hypothetical protein
MSRKLMRPLMRQQCSAAIHESYWIVLWRGRGDACFSICCKPPTGSALQNFL